MSYKFIVGDCLEVMRNLPENSVDACITDPPYGMGMDVWDHSVPSVEIWKEVKRVLKPGAFCLSFCSPQLYHRMASAVDDAGFDILDQIMWMVTTKMPKNNRLKPAHEPIVVAQKPFPGTLKANFEQWGVGMIDITNTRIPWEGAPPKGWVKGGSKRRSFGKEVCTAAGEKAALELFNGLGREKFDDFYSLLSPYKGTMKESTFMTPEQKMVISEAEKMAKKKKIKIYDTFSVMLKGRTESANPAGRYPSNIIGEVLPEHQKYFYAPRATRKERGSYNDHPTPKPISLMSYLVKVYCPPGALVLDPFSGSGTTALGCLQENRKFFGIDISDHYVEISEKRVEEFLQNSLDK